MPYVSRNGGNAISGVFASLQPGIAEEWLDDSDPALAAFYAPGLATAKRISDFKADANYQTLLTQLKAATPAQVSSYITNQVTDLPSARAMLIKMALVLALVANGS